MQHIQDAERKFMKCLSYRSFAQLIQPPYWRTNHFGVSPRVRSALHHLTAFELTEKYTFCFTSVT